MSADLTAADPAFVPYGVPIPKYGVGSTFWVARVDQETRRLPCPDCLGTKTWRVTAPCGAEHELACPRCSDRAYYASVGADRIPPLAYTAYVGRAELFTVGGMDIRSHGHRDDGHDTRVSYYSGPHGGSVFHEHQAYDSEETAKTVADLRAAEMNAKEVETPTHLDKIRFSTLQFNEAILTAAHKSAHDAWWAYTFLKEDVTGCVEDASGWRDVKDLCDELKRHLDFDLNHRRQYRPPTQAAMYDALEAVLAPFADLDSEHLLWLTGEAIRERVQKAANAIIDARAAMRAFVQEMKESAP